MARKKKVDYVQALIAAIDACGLADVVENRSSDGQVALLCRVHDKRQWVALMEYMMVRKTCWDVHLCQQYFLRGPRMIFGWNFILEPQGPVEKAMEEVLKLFNEGAQVVPKMKRGGQLTSFPLVGAGAHRTANTSFDPRLPGPDRGGPRHRGAYNVRSGE